MIESYFLCKAQEQSYKLDEHSVITNLPDFKLDDECLVVDTHVASDSSEKVRFVFKITNNPFYKNILSTIFFAIETQRKLKFFGEFDSGYYMFTGIKYSVN